MTKQKILNVCEDRPEIARPAIRGALHGGTLILKNDESALRGYLSDAIMQTCREHSADKDFLLDVFNLCTDIAKHDLDFIIDLLAMTAGYVNVETLKQKYA